MYVTPGLAGVGPLTCDLGTLAGAPVRDLHRRVQRSGPARRARFDVKIAIQSGTGNTGSDGGNSRGDAVSKTASSRISSSTNFDAGFVVDDLLYQTTTGSLGRGNKQNSTVEVTDTHLTVTVQDGSGVTTPVLHRRGVHDAGHRRVDLPGRSREQQPDQGDAEHLGRLGPGRHLDRRASSSSTSTTTTSRRSSATTGGAARPPTGTPDNPDVRHGHEDREQLPDRRLAVRERRTCAAAT